MLPYITILLGAVCFVVFCVKCHKQRSLPGVFIKAAVSIFFILTAAAGTTVDPSTAKYKYAVLIILGGIFGLLGDIFLDQKWVYPKDDGTYLVSGFTVFGIGHFFYMAAMIGAVNLNWKNMLCALGVGLLVAVVTFILEKPSKLDYGKYKGIIFVYSLILGTMAGTALVSSILTKSAAFIVFEIGALLFLFSDIVLSWIYFGEEKKNNSFNFVLNHATYYSGQFMFALSVALIAFSA